MTDAAPLPDPLDGLPDDVRDKVEEFASRFGEMFLRSLILQGHIVPSEQTEAEIRHDLLEAIVEVITGDAQLSVVLDWRDSLLNWAHQAESKNELRIATILFATWVEHSANLLASAHASRLPMSEQEVLALVRGTSIEAKLTWLLVLYEFPPFDASHLNALKRLAEARNALVHYKWQAADMTSDVVGGYNLTELLTHVRPSLEYLHKYLEDNLVGYDEDHL